MSKYTVARKTVDGHATYHLVDSTRNMEVAVAPGIGNFAYEFKANGHDVLVPPASINEYARQRKFGSGIPFLAPYANRIDNDYYFFQGKKYVLNDAMGNIQRHASKPIHGLLAFDARWKVIQAGATDFAGAFVTSRLEFYKYPDLMEQFPFAHVIGMTYALQDGKLRNTTEIRNVSEAPMPVHVGFHPYFLPDGPRQDWILSLPARYHWLPNNELIPTGEQEPTENYVHGAKSFKLGETQLDDNFSDLERDADGFGRISIASKTRKIEVVYGREYDFSVVYAPPQPLVCIEPQTGPTNAFNLNHEGKFPGLIVLDPGKAFKAEFWIVPTGF